MDILKNNKLGLFLSYNFGMILFGTILKYVISKNLTG